MRYFIGVIIGYLAGCLSPSYLFSILKNVDMRKSGTGNLGATNVMLTLGKKFGIIVMVFDIIKAFVPVLIYRLIYPFDTVLILSVGLSVIVGHCFPFYLKFKGGKGVAAFGGLVLAFDPLMFLVLLLSGMLVALVSNYMFMLPVSCSVLFPVFVGLKTKAIVPTLLAVGVGVTVIVKHWKNYYRLATGSEMKLRDYFKGKYEIIKVQKKDKGNK